MELVKLKEELKALIIEECFQEEDELSATDIADDELLFGSSSNIGLDSLDALQLSVTLKKRYGVRIEGARDGQKYLATVNALADYIASQQAAAS